ncbi:MAG: hypothetical protein JKY37_09195 [Nannocystaceae bacterium]|nr:hypothetical protein [Nannocystaceae bacterium]
MSLLGKVYLGVSLVLLVLGIVWASHALQSNAATPIKVQLLMPRLDLAEPLVRTLYEVKAAALVAGWVVAGAILAVLAIRGPFRIRAAAMIQRRVRELEREVLELRTLPLRQHDEDEALAAEAHLDAGTKKVMTEKILREERESPVARRLGGRN